VNLNPNEISQIKLKRCYGNNKHRGIK